MKHDIRAAASDMAKGCANMQASAREASIAFERFLRTSRRQQERQVRVLKANPHRRGCLYREHVLLVNSGTFWRCWHGRMDHCVRCAIAHPLLYLRWHAMPYLRSIAERKAPIPEGCMHPDTIVGLMELDAGDDEPGDLLAWLRLPSFDYVLDPVSDRWGMAQRVLHWHSRDGWSIAWRR